MKVSYELYITTVCRSIPLQLPVTASLMH